MKEMTSDAFDSLKETWNSDIKESVKTGLNVKKILSKESVEQTVGNTKKFLEEKADIVREFAGNLF